MPDVYSLVREADSLIGKGSFPTVAKQHLDWARKWLGRCDEMTQRHATRSIEVSNGLAC